MALWSAQILLSLSTSLLLVEKVLLVTNQRHVSIFVTCHVACATAVYRVPSVMCILLENDATRFARVLVEHNVKRGTLSNP